MAATLHVHRLEEHHGVENLARRDARGELKRPEDVWCEGPHVREAGLQQLEVPAVARRALILAAHRARQSPRSQPSHGATDLRVVEVAVQDDSPTRSPAPRRTRSQRRSSSENVK